MSVPVFRRSENKLQAYKSTIEMTRYTMHMVENEKIFPKKSRWNIGSRITDNCLDSIIKIRQANQIQVKTIEQAKFRLKLQQDVLLHFDALWSLMTIALIKRSDSVPRPPIAISRFPWVFPRPASADIRAAKLTQEKSTLSSAVLKPVLPLSPSALHCLCKRNINVEKLPRSGAAFL